MNLKAGKVGCVLAAALFSVALLGGCSSGGTDGVASANQYEVPKADGAGLATTAKKFDQLSTNRTTVEAVDLTSEKRAVQQTDEWKVCTQNIEPGAKANYTAKLKVGVVKADESCPETGYKAKVEPKTETGITTGEAEVKNGWAFPAVTPDQSLTDLAKVIDQNQNGDRSNFQVVDVYTAAPAAFDARYKVCFTDPAPVTKINPKSNFVVAIFVADKTKPCMTQEQFNAAG